ncbi:hypothetical protein QR680_015106 [Steinernema hermaphroditum]|uniref:CAP-Gly domain-containing protein n=1 Tax=Steinernema hermaphroditum TaxID=289476 RepID=A0AA39IDD9_9BILA|nr:hypothetical protein QR680_015106 [Steinernema hermaphroditum]
MDFQSMLAKSTSGTAANRGPIISKADVGLRVLVGGGVSGTLRYVGPIIGKDGIFCGVELDYPEGKHNGSFQGVAYFHCPPQHGIFAPLYKVELDGSEPPRNPVTISQLKRPTKLVKSSIATFRSPVQSMMMSESSTSTHIMENSTASTSGVDMDVSMMSTASSNFSNFLDTSLIMNASGVGEEMVTSNATYVICRGAREDEIMNVSEPELPIMLSDESDEDDVIVAANFKNGNATFGETTFEEDDLKTPMAEFYTAPMTVAPASDNTSQRSLSEMSVDTGYHGESDASLLSAGSSFRAEEPEKPEKAKQPIAPIKEETETPKTPPSKPKKERVSLMEQIQQQAKPAQPRAPKAPSKHQLMMEKLKASIAADKVKPKREIKSKLAATIAPVPPTQQAPTANGEMAPAANGTPATPKRTAKTAVNGTASKMAMPPPPPPRVPKPRQPLYVAPPPKERPPKKLKEPTVSRAPSQVSIQSTSTTATTRTKTAAPKGTISGKPFPTSSFAPSTSKIAKKSAVPSTPAAKKEAEAKAKAEAAIALEKLKAERLRKAIDYGDAMVLLYKREYDGKRKVGEENVKLGQQIDSLRREMGDQQEDATLREQRLSKSYEERIREILRNHEAEEERWQEETAKIHRQHQLKCAELDGKLADASEQAERLKRDKRRLEATLAEDEHTKIKTLSAEIQSLNMALEMKSEEMKDMRQKNAALLLRVEEIPCKEQEIQKLKYKVKESQQEIHRLRETEKTLTTQYEDLQRSARKFVAKTEEIAKENDLLRYQMEESMTQSPSPCSKSLHMDTPVRFRGIKPGTMSATLPARVTQSTYGDLDGYDELNRSVISMYQQRGRPQSCNVDTIYAPEGTYTGDVLDEDCDTQKCMVNVTDSGIGLSHH